MDSEVLETIKLLFNEEYAGIRLQLVLILAAGLILYILSNLLIPVILNGSNRKNEIKRQKIERALEDIEKVFDVLKTIQALSISSDAGPVMKRTDELREFVNRRSYRFSSSMRDLILDLLDYYSDCATGRIIKNPEIESDKFELIYREYEKLA